MQASLMLQKEEIDEISKETGCKFESLVTVLLPNNFKQSILSLLPFQSQKIRLFDYILDSCPWINKAVAFLIVKIYFEFPNLRLIHLVTE